ncbi:MAG: hypothetical protein GY754_24060 [bacterium]|nr:hypothetical protein [bacterium]
MKKNKLPSGIKLLFAFILVILYSVPGKTAQRIILFDPNMINVSKKETKIIEELFKAKIYKQQNLERIETGRVKELKKTLNIKKVSDNDAFEIGSFLDSDLLLILTFKKENSEYSLTARLLDVKTRKALFVESEQFNSLVDSEQAINKISDTIFKGDIYLDHYYYICTTIAYLQPVGNYADIVHPGFGISLTIGINNCFINNLSLAVESGYYRFTYLVNSHDTIFHIPLFLCAGYMFRFFDTFSITPVLGFGADFIVISHGSGKGLNIPENSQKSSLEKGFKTGFQSGWALSESTTIILDAFFTSILEQTSLDFVNICLGVKIKL